MQIPEEQAECDAGTVSGQLGWQLRDPASNNSGSAARENRPGMFTPPSFNISLTPSPEPAIPAAALDARSGEIDETEMLDVFPIAWAHSQGYLVSYTF